MEIQIINQSGSKSSQHMGDILSQLLRASAFDRLRMVVAFAKHSGVSRLAEAMQDFRERGGHVGVAVGVDVQATTWQGLKLLLKSADEVYVFRDERRECTFHPKLYIFERAGREAIAFIGSSNLTAGGLYTNYEINISIHFDLTDAQETVAYQQVLDIYHEFTDITSGFARLLDQTLLDDLLARGYIEDEQRQRQDRARAAARTVQTEEKAFPGPIFPSSSVLPLPPSLPMPSLAPSPVAEGETEPVPLPEGPEAVRWETFVMVLSSQDASQLAGHSREIYIPVHARDTAPTFWGWRDLFTPSEAGHPERVVNALVAPPGGGPGTIGDIRLWWYETKKEFRLNYRRLLHQPQAGDILLVRKEASPEYQYRISLVRQSAPEYGDLKAACTQEAPAGPPPRKRFGYF
jgi:HKD family nuclease